MFERRALCSERIIASVYNEIGVEMRKRKEKGRHTRRKVLFHKKVEQVVNVKLWLYDAMWWYAIGCALVSGVLSWLVVQQTAYFGR